MNFLRTSNSFQETLYILEIKIAVCHNLLYISPCIEMKICFAFFFFLSCPGSSNKRLLCKQFIKNIRR